MHSRPEIGENRNAEFQQNDLKEENIMSQKKPNTDIRCRVTSCAFHCGDQEYCSLNAIHVEPCANCSNGSASEESMCGSYRSK